MDFFRCAGKDKSRVQKDKKRKLSAAENGAQSSRDSQSRDNPALHPVNLQTACPTTYTVDISVRRSPAGYGFTLHGSGPAVISRICKGSAADLAGLHTNDVVVCINGLNVLRSTAVKVARIVRESPSEIVLQVQRSRSMCHQTSNLLEVTVSPKPGSPNQRQPFSSISNNIHAPDLPAAHPGSLSAHFDTRSLCAKSDTAATSGRSQPFTRHVTNRHSFGRSESFRLPPPDVTSTPVANFRVRVHDERHRLLEKYRKSFAASGGESEYGGWAESASRRKYCDTNTCTQDRDDAIDQLLVLEQHFYDQLCCGQRQFINPLTHATVLTPSQHCLLFQQIVEIMHLSETRSPIWSEYQLSRTVQDGDGRRSLSFIYLFKLDKTISVYDEYCRDIDQAFDVLTDRNKSADLDQFLASYGTDLQAMTDFLRTPVRFLQNMTSRLQSVLLMTSPHDPDYVNLRHVVQVMTACRVRTERIMCEPVTSLSRDSAIRMSSSLSSSGIAPNNNSSNSSSNINSVVSSIDTELLEIQKKLVFPEHIQVFSLATAHRHHIYSGPLQYVEDVNQSPVPLFVVLASDLLLMTRPDPDDVTLTIVRNPVLLHEVVGANFSCTRPEEFKLCIETPQQQGAWEPLTLTLCAPSTELKHTWKSILEQRIMTCKAQRQRTLANSTVDNFV